MGKKKCIRGVIVRDINDYINKVIQGDCIEAMKQIPDNSIDLVLTDPPYNIKKANWDRIDNYIEWCGNWILECQRVLKDNGSFYFFHNDLPQIAMLIEWIRKNTKFIFNSFITWDKKDIRAKGWKNPSKDNNLRSWFNTCEYIFFYTFQDRTGLKLIEQNITLYKNMREYCLGLRKFIGYSRQKMIDKLGNGRSQHFLEPLGPQWQLCTKETYQELINKFGIDKWEGFREYEDLRREYENLRREYENLRYTHNLERNHKNVWESNKRNDGKRHPTEKPIDIIERIIKASSNAKDIVLDPFLGSGTTAVACKQLGRQFIGIEISEEYVKIAEKRIAEAKRQNELF